MAVSPLPSELPDVPTSRDGLERWLTDRADELAETIAVELDKIVTRAYKAFLKTLPPDTPPAAVTASGDFTPFDAIPGAWNDVVSNEIIPKLEGVTLSGGVSAWVRSSASEIAPSGFASRWANVVNQQALTYLETASNRLKGVGDSIWNDIRNRIAQAIQTGASNVELRQQIETLGDYSEYRADAIARTEVQSAYLNGDWNGATALGVYGPVEKIWLATLDERTRPSHMQLNDKVVPFASPFIVGGYPMLYPHDPAGPAQETVNCRCVFLSLFEGDKRPDGSMVGGHLADPLGLVGLPSG